MRPPTKILIGLFTSATLALPLLLIWFMPQKYGEVREAPDGKYEASVWNVDAGTISGRKEYYIEIVVREKVTRKEVWRIIYTHPSEADVPQYGSRGERFINWAADSASVTVPVPGGQQLVLNVP